MIEIKYVFASANKSDVEAANAQIELNAGIPTLDGKTLVWDTPKKAANVDIWFIWVPDESGWNGKTQLEMIQGVENVDQLVFDPAWIPFPF